MAETQTAAGGAGGPRRAEEAGPAGRPAGNVIVTQIKSGIGTKPKHRGTLRALGLHGIGTSNTLPDRPEIRGMIARVPHLIRVDEQETR